MYYFLYRAKNVSGSRVECEGGRSAWLRWGEGEWREQKTGGRRWCVRESHPLPSEKGCGNLALNFNLQLQRIFFSLTGWFYLNNPNKISNMTSNIILFFVINFRITLNNVEHR